MIQDWMRKYRRPIFWATLLLIIGPFIWWGGGFTGALRDRDKRDLGGPIAVVGDIPIGRQRYRQQLDQEIARRAAYGTPPTYRDLGADGTADKILEDLVKTALFEEAAAQTALRFSRNYLVEQLKEDPSFRNEVGEFDADLWNAWVDLDQNWNAVYARVTHLARQYVFQQRMMASAHVLDADLRKQFEEDHTELQVRFLSIEPPIEPTEDEIRAQYEKDPSFYDTPEERNAEFVAIPLDPPRPALVDELVQRARDGEDFAELASEHSEASTKEEGGEIGWVNVSGALATHRKILAELAVNEVSDPVQGPGGYYVFKVEEDRGDEESGGREVRAREILVRATLSAEERSAREAQAERVASTAKEGGDLAAAASGNGMDVQTSGLFDIGSTTIDNVPDRDAFTFRSALTQLAEGEVSDVIRGVQNLYVAKVIEVKPPVPRSLEEAREEVVEDTIQAIRQSAEYKDKVEKLAGEIAGRAGSLAEILELYPHLEGSIKETRPFSVRTPDYASGLMCTPREVFEAVGRAEPGALGGPLRGFLGQHFFVELIQMTPPDETVWEEQWPAERDRLRRTALAVKMQEQLEDYLDYLYRQARAAALVRVDSGSIANMLGLDQEPSPAAEGS